MTDLFPSFNHIGPFDRTLSTKTMKSICKWADRNKDNKLTQSEIDRAKRRLVQMKYTSKQQAQQEQQLGFSFEHYGYRYGHYLEAARAGADKPFYRDDLGPVFRIDQLDVISGYDNKLKDISAKDWEEYMKPPVAYA